MIPLKLKITVVLLVLAFAMQGQIFVVEALENQGIGGKKFTYERLGAALDYDKKALFDNPLNQVVFLNLDGKIFEIPPFGLLEYFPIRYGKHKIKSWTKEQTFWESTIELAEPAANQKNLVYFFNLTKSHYTVNPVVYSHRPALKQKRLEAQKIGPKTLFFPVQYDPNYSILFEAPQIFAKKEKLDSKSAKDDVLWKISRVQDVKTKAALKSDEKELEKRILLEMNVQNAFADLNNALISNGLTWSQKKISKWKEIAQQLKSLNGQIDQLLPSVKAVLDSDEALSPLVAIAYDRFEQAIKTYHKLGSFKGKLRFGKKEAGTKKTHFRSIYEKNQQFYLLYDGLFLENKKEGLHFCNNYPQGEAYLFGGTQEETFYQNNILKYSITGYQDVETKEVDHLYSANLFKQDNGEGLVPLVYRKQHYNAASRLIMQTELPNFNPLKNAVPNSKFIAHYFDEMGNEINENTYKRQQLYKEYQLSKGNSLIGKFFLFYSKYPWLTTICLLIIGLIGWFIIYRKWPVTRLKIIISFWSFISLLFGVLCLYKGELGVLGLTSEIGWYLLISLLLFLLAFQLGKRTK